MHFSSPCRVRPTLYIKCEYFTANPINFSSCIYEFRLNFHSTDVVNKQEALDLLRSQQSTKATRESTLHQKGYPAYTTQVGWLGYSDVKVRELCAKYLDLGFTAFKAKVGQDLKDDTRRCGLIREAIGYDNILMVDANQIWEVEEAISWMKQLAKFKPLWIEEPTSPDDVLGHARIAKELRPLGIGVATGEMCANRVMFKQMLQAGALDYCQIDSARIGGVNEILAVYLMAKKLNGERIFFNDQRYRDTETGSILCSSVTK